MVSLILPPIILVVAITLLVYFFSRRLPLLEARVREKGVDAAAGVSWWSVTQQSIQHAFWHVLDKTVRKFKLGLLKGHNIFNALSDSVRRQREVSQKNIAAFRKERAAKSGTPPVQPFHSRWFQPHMAKDGEAVTQDTPPSSQPSVSEPEALTDMSPAVSPKVQEAVVPDDTPYVRRRKMAAVTKPLVTPPIEEFQPLPVSEVSRPRRAARKAAPVEEPRQKDQFEEILIERIVSNPRDVEAYERLGDYYLEHENYVDAKECYRQVLKLSPVNRLVKIKIRRLEKILGK